MNILNSNYYNNEIYKAIVVNEDYNSDPEKNGRVQIYLPDFQTNYADIYKSYMNSPNKSTTGNMDKFPWAVSLVKDLKNGDIVYGNFINNESGKFIILGLQANINVPGTVTQGSGYLITGEELTKYATAIIVENEVGLDTNDFISGNIGEDKYGFISGNDNGAFSIGLIQWHACKAFSLLCKIKTNLPNWENCWSDKEDYLYKDLKAGKAQYNNYNTYKVTNNTSTYNSIRQMLVSPEGKQTQYQHSSDDTYANITDLQNNYDISNPAVIIFLCDLMNQYGSGLPGTKDYARAACGSTTNIMDALYQVVDYCKNNIASYYTYERRRNNTIAYIEFLNSQGKFSCAGLVEIGIAEGAIYCYPFKGSAAITCGYGQGPQGYSNGKKHRGIDFGLDEGTEVYAIANGELESFDLPHSSTTYSGKDAYWYGNFCVLHTDDGNHILYCHLSQTYGISGRVSMGEAIGLSGNTGNSSGPHLHLEVRDAIPYGNDINPAPLIGIENVKYSTVDFV